MSLVAMLMPTMTYKGRKLNRHKPRVQAKPDPW